MAHKRKTTAKRKRSTNVPAIRRKTSAPLLKARRRRKGLSAGLNKSSLMATGKDLIAGIGGGTSIAVLDKVVGKISSNKMIEYGVNLAGSFVAHNILKMPNLACGMAGAIGYKLGNDLPFLNDDASFVAEDILSEMPLILDEDGNPYSIDEDGNMISIEEAEAEEF